MISAATRPAAAVAGTRSWGAKKASRGLSTGWGEIRQDTPAAGEERALPARGHGGSPFDDRASTASQAVRGGTRQCPAAPSRGVVGHRPGRG
jgi:hypothetical protein